MSSINLDTRTRILSETLRLMEKQHGQGVRMSDIARSTGISRQALYLHFASRTYLLVAAVRHYDEIHDIDSRLKPIYEAKDGIQALNAYVEFWGNYIPEIHGLAKALLAVIDTDEDAAAAWSDRMEALRYGCSCVINCLDSNEILNREWKVNEAIDLMWMILSVRNWENLITTCGWTNEQYIQNMKTVLKDILVRQD